MFSYRLYRENCIKTDNGLYIKDLRVINRDLKSTLIVDNTAISFAFQLNNGIPIIPYHDEKDDNAMSKLVQYLMSIKDLDNIRERNGKTFGLEELLGLNVPSFLKYYYEDPEVTKHREMRATIKRSESNNIETQLLVENELGKFKESLPRYLAKSMNIKEHLN